MKRIRMSTSMTRIAAKRKLKNISRDHIRSRFKISQCLLNRNISSHENIFTLYNCISLICRRTIEENESNNEIVMRYALMKKNNFVRLISSIQITLNNFANASIEMSSNEVLYEFKVTKFLNLLTNSIILEKINDENSFTSFEKERVIIRKKVEEAIIFANVAMKIRHDLTRKSLKMNVKDVVYFKLHKRYTQSDLSNRKFSKQRFESVKIIEKISKLAYRLEISQS